MTGPRRRRARLICNGWNIMDHNIHNEMRLWIYGAIIFCEDAGLLGHSRARKTGSPSAALRYSS